MANTNITYEGVTYNLSDPTQFQAYQTRINRGQTPTQASTQSTQSLVNTYNQGGGQPLTSQQIGSAINSSPGTLSTQLGTQQSNQQASTPLNVAPYEATPFPTLPSVRDLQMPDRQLPEAPKAPDLVGLADALDYAGQLAKTKRNELLLGIMKPSQGVGPASDFNSILNNLNRAGVSFIEGQANRVFDAANQEYQAQKESFNRAYELALSDYDFQRALLVDDIQAQREILLKKWEVENSVNEKNYDLQTKLQISQYEDQKSQAQQEKTNIQSLASELASSGADQSTVNAILNAGNLNSAISIASGWYQSNTDGQYVLKEDGKGNLVQIQVDPKTGEFLGQKTVISGFNPQSSGGGTGSGTSGQILSSVTGKPLTEGERLSQGYATRATASDAIITELGSKFTGASAYGQKALPNLLKSSEYQQYEQAQRDFVNAVLRRESGAAIAESEFESARQQYFPQPGDSPEVVAQKTVNRQNTINSLRLAGGQVPTQSNNDDPLGIYQDNPLGI